MLRRARLVALVLAVALPAAAVDFPKATGYVNDFARRLTEADRAALREQLSGYERATSNEVVIAVVNSLDGQPVDQYANGLFRAWGIGKKDRNNGVLFLWAPTERKLRIEVGMGLEQTIPNSAAAEILSTVTAFFRREDYSGGVHAAVDGILAKLGDSAPPSGTQAAPEIPPLPEPKNDALLLIPLVLAVGGIGAVIVFLWSRGRKRELMQSLPRDLDGAASALNDADALAKNAATALNTLRQEAPAAVWSEYADNVSGAPAELSTLRAEAAAIRAMPRETLRELAAAHRALVKWNIRFSRQWEWLAGAQARLDSFRYCREQSQALLPSLRQSLKSRRRRRAVEAADETYQQAVAAAATSPVNWLLVHDLLMDVQDCLAYTDDPDAFRYTRRVRNCVGLDNYDSPALLYLMTMSQQQQASADNTGMDFGGGGGGGSSDSGGGGGDSGSFGGGDTGGGGSSSDY